MSKHIVVIPGVASKMAHIYEADSHHAAANMRAAQIANSDINDSVVGAEVMVFDTGETLAELGMYAKSFYLYRDSGGNFKARA